jgi:hypothetical protein
MKEDCKLVTPPSPPFLISGDSRGFTGAASCLESISFELIDSKGVSRGAQRGVRNDNRADYNPYTNTSSKLMSRII